MLAEAPPYEYVAVWWFVAVAEVSQSDPPLAPGVEKTPVASPDSSTVAIVVQNEPVLPVAVSVLASPNPIVPNPVSALPVVPFANALLTVSDPVIAPNTHLSAVVGSMFRPLSLITRLMSAPFAYVSGSNATEMSPFKLPQVNVIVSLP